MVLAMRIAPLEWRRRRYFPHKKSSILRHTLQSGIISILSTHCSDPLKFWSITPGNGTIQRILATDVDGFVISVSSPAFCTTYISAPEDIRMNMSCGMPLLTLIIEYLSEPFCFEFQLKDSKNAKRRYRCSACQVISKLSPLICHVPIHLCLGWNKIEVNLESLTHLTYNANYCELLGLQIYANCRIKHVYFSDRKYEGIELPREYILKEPFYKKDGLSSYRSSSLYFSSHLFT